MEKKKKESACARKSSTAGMTFERVVRPRNAVLTTRSFASGRKVEAC